MSSESVVLDEVTEAFITEAREMLEEVEPSLIELGQRLSDSESADEETVNSIFRLFHSIKGGAGFMQFNNIVKVTHEAETLLDLFRSGKEAITTNHTDLLCKACDYVSLLLDQIQTTAADKGIESEVDAITLELTKAITRLKTGVADEPVFESHGDQVEDHESLEPGELEEHIVSTENDAVTIDAEPEKPSEPEFVFPIGDLIERFVQEADEQLDTVEQVLLVWEKTPGDMDEIANAFRALHSFKGNCGMCGFTDLERLSHHAESVLESVKEKRLELDSMKISSMLYIVDSLRGAVADLSRGEDAKIDGLEALVDMLADMLPKEDRAPEPAAKREEPATKPMEPAVAIPASPPAAPTPQAKPPAPKPKPEPPGTVVRADIKQEDAIRLLRADESSSAPGKPEMKAPVKARSVFRNDIRVDLRKLDQLINLVGELVIAESMVTENPDLEGLELENYDRATTHLKKIVRDLQDVAMSVRMIPIGGVFRKMIRLVHDLSVKAGKKVNLELAGEDVEIDKTVAEQLADPLVHLVRNSIDHGLEPPNERTAAGKPETGELFIEARHEGGEVLVVIHDDGRGMNRERILAKGIENGLVQGTGEDMTDEEVFNLVFEPGFSTAEQVTDISGRGVGMDVVKQNLGKIKGRVDIRSIRGKGTTFILRIPLTLAIMEGMLIRVGQSCYTIPILSIRESLQVTPDQVTKTMDGQELVKVREEILPAIRLHQLHRIKADHEELENGLLVILESQGEAYGLLVDEILGEQQTVIKGLSNFMGDVRGVSGCTILGDGEVSLIIDVGGLLKFAKGEN